jgi:hypothetical protein
MPEQAVESPNHRLVSSLADTRERPAASEPSGEVTMQRVCNDMCTCSPAERSYYLNFLGVAIGVIFLCVGAIYLDQAVHSISGGYEDALCIAKAGQNLTSDYCKYEDSQTGFCYQYVSCCDHPVIAYPKIQASNVSGIQLTMRARACATSKPCAAFYEWLKLDSLTTIQSTDKIQNVAFPCKYNTARLVKNFESTNYCGLSRFQVFGPLESGTGWCGVVSSSAEYPTLQDADAKNQQLKPLWIILIVAGPCVVLACYLANRAPKPGNAAAQPESQAASQPTPANRLVDLEPGPHPTPVPAQKHMEELRQQSKV